MGYGEGEIKSPDTEQGSAYFKLRRSVGNGVFGDFYAKLNIVLAVIPLFFCIYSGVCHTFKQSVKTVSKNSYVAYGGLVRRLFKTLLFA